MSWLVSTYIPLTKIPDYSDYKAISIQETLIISPNSLVLSEKY